MQNNNGSRVIPTTVFLLYRKLLVSYKVKTLREDAHLAEKKLAANSTARARKSRKRLFVHLSRATTYCFTDRKKSDLLVDQASFEFRFTINAAINPSVAVCQFERVW